jgi:hypothetical protein
VLYDAFICHASEDNDGFVRPLAKLLVEQHVEIWYDEFSLNVGDSLRRSIDQGLSQSRFGVVVLSPSFFSKQWSQWELDGLVGRQNSGTETVILPGWHGVTRDDVMGYSPSLADKLAAPSDLGLDEVARRLVAAIHPQGSTLVIARNHLLEWGLSPPVVTDDWWLDIAAAAESNDMEGGWQEPMGWGRWGFPLPPTSRVPAERGWRLAWAAMQTKWQQEVEIQPVTQITRPDRVHEFIASQPGLHETCAVGRRAWTRVFGNVEHVARPRRARTRRAERSRSRRRSGRAFGPPPARATLARKQPSPSRRSERVGDCVAAVATTADRTVCGLWIPCQPATGSSRLCPTRFCFGLQQSRSACSSLASAPFF